MKKKKLLIFHPAIAPYRVGLFNELSKNFECDFYFFYKNLRSQKFDIGSLHKELLFEPKFLLNGFTIKRRIFRIGYLRKITIHKPDIILTWEYNPITILVLLYSRIFYKNKKVITICDDSFDVASKCNLIRKVARKICMKLLNGIVLGNEDVKIWYKTKYPDVPSVVFPIIQKETDFYNKYKKTDTLYLEYIKKYNLSDRKIILFVGRIVEVKNLNLLLEAFSKSNKINNNATLILIGDGNKKNELMEIVAHLNMQESIIFPGRFENEYLYAWYRVADYFVLPSISETFGAVVNEALLAGVPVICSKLAGAASLINESNGLLFDPYNIDELIHIFKNKLNNDKFRDKSVSDNISLMPYRFDDKMTNLLKFLWSN